MMSAGSDGEGKGTKRVSTYINHRMFDLVTRVSRAQGSALLVMYSLARHHNHAEGCSRPSTALIAAETHMTIRNVHRVVAALEVTGEVSVYRQKDQVNRYYLRLKDTPDSKLEFARRVMRLAFENSGKYRPVANSHNAPRMTTSSRGTGQPRHATTGQGRHAAHDKVVTLIINEQSEGNQGTSSSSALEAVPTRILEEVEKTLVLPGNRARGKNKRYACKLTREKLLLLASQLLEERGADLVEAALTNFNDGYGFTSGKAWVQRLALRKWVLMQKPPLMEETIALLKQVDADAVLAAIGLSRFVPFPHKDFERYIKAEELHRLHEALKVAV
jgi:hypothetical protein